MVSYDITSIQRFMKMRPLLTKKQTQIQTSTTDSHFPRRFRKKGKILTLLRIRLSSFLPQPSRSILTSVYAASVANKEAKAHQVLGCWLWWFWFKRYGLRTDTTWSFFTFLFLIFEFVFIFITYRYHLVRSFIDSWTMWQCLNYWLPRDRARSITAHSWLQKTMKIHSELLITSRE
jgi:hypothetical protein